MQCYLYNILYYIVYMPHMHAHTHTQTHTHTHINIQTRIHI